MNAETQSDYRTELRKYGAIAFVPRGNSMWPTLKNRGQSVVVQKKSEKLKRYDVALYVRGEDKFVLHRVMEPTETGYVICGDSQFTFEKVNEEQVFGVMSGFYRGKKFISCDDEKYKRQTEKWFARKTRRKIRLKIFFFGQRVKGLFRRVFRGKKVQDDV